MGQEGETQTVYEEHLCQRKRAGQTVIGHVSDLHFCNDTQIDDFVWQSLAEDLRGRSVDIIAATGDLIDSSISDVSAYKRIEKAFKNVHEYLTGTLCKSAGIDPKTSLFIVPGNHDFRWKGICARTTQFDLFYEEFKREFRNAIFPKLKLATFVFDSNTTDRSLNFASGLVRREHLVSFRKLVSQIRSDRPNTWADCTKVALVHHHPMPIAPTEHRLAVTDREELLLLKNAGMFMTEMVRANVDIVLHGHKHYPAYSRASYPCDNEPSQTIAVVAAGSVGRMGQHERSYNLLTISDSGETELERRILRGASYEREVQVLLEPYSELRGKKAWSFAKSQCSKLAVKGYVRQEVIAAGSGDTEITEEYSNVSSFSDAPVPQIEHIIGSKSGKCVSREYLPKSPGQTIKSIWLSQWKDGQRKCETVFDPPVGRTPISFVRKSKNVNSIHFNRRDRLDATGQAETEENVSVHLKQAYELFTLHLQFPEDCFPRTFRLEVYNDKGERNGREEEYASSRMAKLPESHAVALSVDHPFPGHTYRVLWELPEDEENQYRSSPRELGIAKEIICRLISARSSATDKVRTLSAALRELADTINASPDFVSSDLEVTLFARSEEAGGLVCVSAYGPYSDDSRLWQWVVKPGVAIVGQAYRRREDVFCVGLDDSSEEAGYYEATPGRSKHSIVYCCPLFFPPERGHRVGVLSLASRSNLSNLLKLPGDEAAFLALKEQLLEWYFTSLLPSLGIGVLQATDNEEDNS